jgi:hypothetical protein
VSRKAPADLATLTAKQVQVLRNAYDAITKAEAATRKSRDKFGTHIKGLMAAGATRRDLARALDVTDQTVTNLAYGRARSTPG